MSKRSAVVGFAAVMVIMSAGAAQSLSGSNTVFSDDIVNGTIAHVDIKENTIGGSRLLDNAVTSSKILDTTIQSQDVKDQSLVAGQDFGSRADSVSLNFGSITSGDCAALTALSGGFGTFTTFATALTASSSWPFGLSVHARSTTTMSGETLQIVACNVSGGPVDAPATTFKIVTFKVP